MRERFILRFEKGKVRRVKDILARESELEIFLNGERVARLKCLPVDMESLAVGFLLSEGLVSEVERVSVGGGIAEVEGKKGRKKKPEVLKISPERVKNLVSEFEKSSEIFKKTGCVHSAALSDGEKLLFVMEDIGRSNAIDKVIGKAYLEGIDVRDKILITSGRITSETLKKLVKVSIPAAISVSAPTDKAVSIARRKKLLLIGFARGDRMNIYSPITFTVES